MKSRDVLNGLNGSLTAANGHANGSGHNGHTNGVGRVTLKNGIIPGLANGKTKHGVRVQNSEVATKALSVGNLRYGILTGDAIAALKLLPSDSINVAITSPPYFWVRDYQVEGQIGHEESVEEYVNKLADVFDEVRRVLHPEGVFYLNIGDTFYSGNGQPHGQDPRCASRNFMRVKMRPVDKSGWDIPKKTLIGIPWKLAFALQQRKWAIRSDIIWTRSNAFSEPSARDRPKRQYEHLFLLTKSRFYSYDTMSLEAAGDVWEFPIERNKIIDHNAPFPQKLVERCIATGSPEGGRVLDPFLGSGTTLKVAVQMKRHCVGIDLKPDYTRQVADAMTADGCKPSEWSEVAAILNKPCDELRKWRGHVGNMRKPGTKPFTSIKR